MFLIVDFKQVNAIRELYNLSDFWQVDRHFRKEEIDFNNFSWVWSVRHVQTGSNLLEIAGVGLKLLDRHI